MYHIQCPGGFALPIKKGKFEVLGFSMPVSNTGAASEIALVDADPFSGAGASQPTDTAYLRTIIDKKGITNVDANLECWFPEPIKVRDGLAMSKCTNLIVGKMMVFIK